MLTTAVLLLSALAGVSAAPAPVPASSLQQERAFWNPTTSGAYSDVPAGILSSWVTAASFAS